MSASPRKGFRACTKCGRNRNEKNFKPRGRICATCRKRRVSTASREVRLWDLYSITLDEYAAIVEAQGGHCAICQGVRPYSYDVDHDHALEKALIAEGVAPAVARRQSVRGALCRRCNRRLLPSALDSVHVLDHAIAYLSNPPAFAVLREC